MEFEHSENSLVLFNQKAIDVGSIEERKRIVEEV